MAIKLKELLKTKKPDDEWYSVHAPEEVRVWTTRKPWKKGTFSKKGVRALAVAVFGQIETSEAQESFTMKSPLVLNCGVELTGKVRSRQYVNVSLKGRVDDCMEINRVMKELSSRMGIKNWEVRKLTVYNPNEAVDVEFELHNPDGHGSGLYLFRVCKGKVARIYPNIMLSDQLKYVDRFYENIAHCRAKQIVETVHGCALEKKKPKRQIKRRKK